jgi:hypothetical protein
LGGFVVACLCFVFETGSHYVAAQAGLRLSINLLSFGDYIFGSPYMA